MTQKKFAPDGSRELRDGEMIVDCARALALFQASDISGKEEAAAAAINISRSVLRRIIGRDGDRPWNIVATENVRAFSIKCGGQPVDIEWAGQVDAHGDATRSAVSSYLGLWQDLHVIDLGPYVPLSMRCGETDVSLKEIVSQLKANPNLQVIGPSGCGKSHLLAHVALTMRDEGFVPITIQAGHFTGELAALVEQAIASASTLRFSQLVKACAAQNLIPVVVVDAFNECAPDLRPRLLAALQELRIHFHAPIILSSQNEINLPSTLAGSVVRMPLPDALQKRQIVEAHLKRPLPAGADFALDVIQSAHDAMLWAAVFDHSDPASSRYVLYETFARLRLGSSPDTALAYRALGEIAAEMRNQFVFSVPEPTLARIIARTVSVHAHEGIVVGAIKDSGLVQFTNGRAAFRHELLQHFFAAESLLVDEQDPAILAQALAKPINAELAEFAIGSLSSVKGIDLALENVRSHALLVACLSARCGPVAQQSVRQRCIAAAERLADRVCAATFDYSPAEQRHRLPLVADISQCPPLQELDRLYLVAAVTIAATDETLLGSLMSMFGRIDAHLESERQRLRARYPEKKIGWRMGLFTGIYCLPLDIELSDLQHVIQTGRMAKLWQNPDAGYRKLSALLAQHQRLSPGQLYFLIEEFHSAYRSDVSPPPHLYELVERTWKLGIYHLRLATAHLLYLYGHRASEEEGKRFIELARSWLSNEDPFLNGIVIDVLKAFNALDDEFTSEQAMAEFNEVLALPPCQEAFERAFTLYGSMFDHPFEAAYGTAFYELDEERRKTLFSRAVFTEATDSMSFSFLVGELARNPVPEAIPALQRVAVSPRQDTISIQESVSTFVSAVTALSRLQAPLLADESDDEPATSAWRRIRTILYSLHRPGISRDQYERETADQWESLHKLRAMDVAMRIVRDRWRDDDETTSRFYEWSGAQLLRLARNTLNDNSEPASSFTKLHRYGELRSEHLEFALSIIGAYGDRSDLPALTSLLDDSKYGASAIKAARAIESR